MYEEEKRLNGMMTVKFLIRNSRSSAAVPLFGLFQPFKLHTDACGLGLGAVLYQKQDGMDRVIIYASRILSKSEKNYPALKLKEFLTLKWAVT